MRQFDGVAKAGFLFVDSLLIALSAYLRLIAEFGEKIRV